MAEKLTYEELEKRIKDLEKENSKFKRLGDALEKQIVALTQPLKEEGDIAFEDLFNIDDIQRIQDEFAKATGVASIITRTDGTPITAPSNFCRLCNDIIRKTDKGLTNCFKSDAMIGRYHPGGPIIQPCMSGGLWDAGAGITVGGRHIANWLIGQVRNELQTEDQMLVYAREIGADEKVVVEAFREVSAMSRERFEQIAKVLFTFANQLSTTAYQNVQQARLITEIKQAEKTLQESEKKHRELLDGLNDTAYRMSLPDGKYEYFSQAAKNVFGYDSKSWLNNPQLISKIIHPDFIDYFKQEWADLIDGRVAESYEYKIIDPEGNERWIFQTNTGIVNDQGKVIAIEGLCRNITERKQAEEGREKLLKALHEALENVKTLNGLLPICAHCKNIRDDKGYWNQIEGYIQKHSYAKFSHGMCPDCSNTIYGKEDWYIKMKKKKEQKE